jgi:hypothetical protein
VWAETFGGSGNDVSFAIAVDLLATSISPAIIARLST